MPTAAPVSQHAQLALRLRQHRRYISQLPCMDGCLPGAELLCMLSAVAAVEYCFATTSIPGTELATLECAISWLAKSMHKKGMAGKGYCWRSVLAWHWKCGCLLTSRIASAPLPSCNDPLGVQTWHETPACQAVLPPSCMGFFSSAGMNCMLNASVRCPLSW